MKCAFLKWGFRWNRTPLVSVWTTSLVVLTILGNPGRARAEGEPIQVPERVVIPVGGITDFEVKIDRDLFEGKATVTLAGLPGGVEIIQGDGVIPSKKGSASFTLRANKDVQGEQDHQVTVVASAGVETKETEFTLHTENFFLSTTSWIIMLVSVGSVLTLVSFCLWRVLTLPPTEEESLHGPTDIDTGDTQDVD